MFNRAQARKIVADETGMSDTEKLNNLLEDIRAMVYALYSEVDYIPKAVMCFEVQCFLLECAKDCTNVYKGITLPPHLESVDGGWAMSEKHQFRMKDQWREWSPAVTDKHGCDLVISDVPTESPHELDIDPLGTFCQCGFISSSRADNGKAIHVKYITDDFVEHSESIKMANTLQLTSRRVRKFTSISFDDHCGSISLHQHPDARKLSEYAPGEVYPSFRRIKFENLPTCVTHVSIIATRRHVAMTSDSDIFEVSNRVAIQDLARHFKLKSIDRPKVSDINSAEYFEAKAKELMLGDLNRSKSKKRDRRVHFGKNVNIQEQVGLFRRGF